MIRTQNKDRILIMMMFSGTKKKIAKNEKVKIEMNGSKAKGNCVYVKRSFALQQMQIGKIRRHHCLPADAQSVPFCLKSLFDAAAHK